MISASVGWRAFRKCLDKPVHIGSIDYLRRLVDFGPARQKSKGEVRGALSFYGPRQQMSIVYGNDLASEPLPVSSIGEVIEGHDKLELIGTKAWLEPGARVWISLIEE